MMKSKLLIKKASEKYFLQRGGNFAVRRRRAALECLAFPVNRRGFRAPVGVDAWFSHHTRNSMGTSRTFLKMSLPKNDISFITQWSKQFGIFLYRRCTWNYHGTGRRLRRELQSWTVPTLRFVRNHCTGKSMHHIGGTYSQKLFDRSSGVCHIGIACRTIPRPGWLSLLESQLQYGCVCRSTQFLQLTVSWINSGTIYRRSHRVAI